MLKRLALITFALVFGLAGVAQSQNEVLTKTKIEYSFQSSVYSPTADNDLSTGSPTVVAFTCDEGGTGLSNGTAVNSQQVDLGTTRPRIFHITANLEWFSTPSATNSVDFYWSPSSNSNAGVGNPGSPDGACTNTPATADCLYAPSGFTDDEGVKQMMFVGAHINNGNAAPQLAYVGSFEPPMQYGQLIMFNKSGTALCATDDIESSVLMTGVIDEVQ